MPYTPNNNPYIPGDPYSYDLKWIVRNIKQFAKSIEEFAELKDYFDSANFEQIVSDKLEEMLENGELDQLAAAMIGAVKSYETEADLNASTTDVGGVVAYQNELYTIAASDNGYGIPTVNGYAVRDFTTQQIFTYELEKFFRYYLLNAVPNSLAQASCYAEPLRTTAYFIRHPSDDTLNQIVFVTDNGTVTRRYCSGVNGNDMCYIESLNRYCLIYDYTSSLEPNFVLLDPDGVTDIVVNQADPNWKDSNIAYDKKHDRLISAHPTFIAIYEPTVENGKFKLLATPAFYDADIVVPNSENYTAWQGSACDDLGNFFTVSSVFYGDSFRKPTARICQIDTITGRVIDYCDYEFALTGTEAESIYFRKDKLHICGYTVDGLCQIIAGVNSADAKPDSRQSAIIYYNPAGNIANDGLTPNTPVNDLFLACCIAGSYTKGIVYMQADEPQANAGVIFPTFKKALTITSSESTKRNVYSTFSITNGSGYFELQYVILNQIATNRILTIASSAISATIFNTELKGTANSTNNELVRVDNGGVLTLHQVIASDIFVVATITNGSRLYTTDVTGNGNADRICAVNYGSLACIDTSQTPATGFTNIGYEYGGKIIQGSTGLIS